MVHISESSLTKETETSLPFLAHVLLFIHYNFTILGGREIKLKLIFLLISEEKYSVYRHCMLWMCLPITSEKISDFHENL
jgi:hypothetical protein